MIGTATYAINNPIALVVTHIANFINYDELYFFFFHHGRLFVSGLHSFDPSFVSLAVTQSEHHFLPLALVWLAVNDLLDSLSEILDVVCLDGQCS